MILRLEVDKAGRTAAWLYDKSKAVASLRGGGLREVSGKISQALCGNWSKLQAALVFRGPAGFSRLRATHAFALGLHCGLGIPVVGYDEWDDELLAPASFRDRSHRLTLVYNEH